MTEEKKSDFKISNRLIELSKKYDDEYLFNLLLLNLKILKKLSIQLIAYGFVSLMFLTLYDLVGIEKTAVILGVSLVYWGFKQNFLSLKKSIILEQMIKDEHKRRNARKTK